MPELPIVLLASKPTARRFATAAALVAAATLARLALQPALGDHLPFLAFYPTVLVATWLGGVGPGLFSVALSTLVSGVLFVHPERSLPFLPPLEWLSLLVFAGLGALFCMLANRIRSDSTRLRLEREHSERGRELAERRLLELEQRLELAQAAGKVGFFEYDFATGRVHFTGALNELLGSGLPSPHQIAWRSCARHIVAEDAKELVASVASCIERGRSDLDYELRVRSTAGALRWLAGGARIAYDANRRPWRMTGALVDFTARKHMEEALRESEQHYRGIFDQAAVGMARLSLERRLLDVNAGLCEMLGYPREEVIGRCLRELAHPEDRTQLDGAIHTLTSGGSESISLEQRFRHHDGSHLSTHTTLSPMRDGAGNPRSLVLVARDITEQLRTDATLRFLAGASALLATVVDARVVLSRLARLAVPDFADWCAVDLLAADGGLERIALAGPAGGQWLAAAAACGGEVSVAAGDEATIVQPCHFGVHRVVGSGRPEWIRGVTAWTRSGAAPEAEIAGLRAAGFTSFLCVPLRVHGRPVGALSFGILDSGRRYDDGDLAAAQDLAHRVGTAIENAQLYQELREADKRKDEFLATLGHELRNPLVPIRSGIDLLTMDSGAPAEITGLMRQQVEHLIRLVDDLLDVSRIARGRVELRREPVRLSTLLERAAAAMREPLGALEQELHVALPDEDPLLEVDPVRLVQVIENLLHNASKFTARGGRIELHGRRENGSAILAVRDSGMGIEPDLLPHVFEPFTQSPRSRDQGGLGIGLSLVRGLVEMHGGTVSAASPGAGAGSEFTVRLPIPHQPAAATIAAEPAPRRALAGGRRILVVDDNVQAAKMLDLLLRRMGPHEIATAHDGFSALELLPRFAPDIVLLDIGLPGIDGHEVGRRIRKDPQNRGVLLVALTGYGQEEDRRRSRQAGFDAHLVKPPSLDDLERLLHHPKLVAPLAGPAEAAPS